MANHKSAGDKDSSNGTANGDKDPVWEYDTKTGQHRIVVGDHAGEWATYIAIAQLTTPRGASYIAASEYYRGTFQPGKVYQTKLVPSRERIASVGK